MWTNRFTWSSLWIFLLIIGFGLFTNSCNRADVIHVAVVSSQTGDLAEIGQDMARGATMRIEEVNAQGGVKGSKLRYHLFDDQGDPKVAVSIAHRVSQDDRISAIVGHLTSGCMAAAAPVYARSGVPVVMPVPTNPDITAHGYNNLFRVPPTDADQAPYLAKYLLKRDPKGLVAIVNDLTAYGVGFAEAFRNTYKAGQGKIVAFEGAEKSERDFRTIVTKLKALHSEYIVLGATYDMGAPFVRQMRELGLNSIVLAGDGCYGTEFLQIAGTAAEGSIVSFIAPDRSSSAETEEFFKNFEDRYGKVVSFAPLGYDAAGVVIESIRMSKTAGRSAILETLNDPNFIFGGVTGDIQFDDKGDNININLTLYVVQQGEWVLLR